jgi:hypothetical protein
MKSELAEVKTIIHWTGEEINGVYDAIEFIVTNHDIMTIMPNDLQKRIKLFYQEFEL